MTSRNEMLGVTLPSAEGEPLPFTGERFDPGLSGEIVHEHLHRYLWALQFCAGKDVLDIASGEGYGSFILAQAARAVTGVDLSTDAVAHAQARYQRSNLRYAEGSAEAIPLPDASVDVVVSFETLEHMHGHDAFLAGIVRVLRPGGLLVMSSPDREFYSAPGIPPNPYHVRELTSAEFKALIGRSFPNAIYGVQKATSGSLIVAEGPAEQRLQFHARGRDGQMKTLAGLSAPLYVVAVASQGALPKVVWGVLDDPDYVPALRARGDMVQGEATRLEREVARLHQETTRLNQETTRLNQETTRLGAELNRANEALLSQQQVMTRALEQAAARTAAEAAEKQAAQAEAQGLRSIVQTMEHSRSWKMTRPLRDGMSLVRRLRETRSLKAVAWEGGRIAIDKLPEKPRDTVRSWKKKVLGNRPPHPDIGREDLDNARVSVALKRLLADLAAGRPADAPITHVVAVPFLMSGGADLTATNYLRALAGARGAASCLLVVADRPDVTVPGWVPAGVRVVRIDDYIDAPSERERVDVLHGLLRALSARVLHNVNSVVAWHLIIHRGAALSREVRLFGSIFAFQFASDGSHIGYAADFFEQARPHLAGLITDNGRFARDLAAEYALDEEWQQRIHVVHNPSRSDGEVQAADRKPGEPLRVLWAGRIDREKLPEVLQAVADQSPFATFDVFGAAVVDADRPALVASERLRLRGPYRELKTLFESGPHDAFVFTSKWEGMPNILLEVGARGIPIVAPDVGGVPELVNDATGYLVAGARNVDGYVRALVAIHADPAGAAARAARLLEVVRERHSWSRFSQTLLAIPGYA